MRSADRGTLFLDEIGDLPLVLQGKLLRVLQEREVLPVGETRAVPVELFIVAATHRNLDEMVVAGTILPFGVTLGLLGRVAGGISMQYAFWREGDAAYQQLAPLRLSVTARLLPIFPLGSSTGGHQSQDGETSHYIPPSSFHLGLNYEHEVRVWKFDGANSLGLLTDLATLRVIGSKRIGPVQLSASIGALYDWHGLFATGEAAAQVGLYLPFFKALKVFIEALARGFPAYTKNGTLMPGLDGQDPIHPQGSLGLGFSFHPHARVDLGISVQRGFGGLAP